MLRWSNKVLKARVTVFSPWKRRPSGLSRNSTPEMVHPGNFAKSHRKTNPDDPTGLLKPNHVLLKVCPVCQRSKYIPLHEKQYFHSCCEGVVMRYQGTMKTVMQKAHDLQTMHRQWNVEAEQPWCNPTKPRPKGRSKFKK